MAKADYALCAHCDGKAFYDAETDTLDTVTFHPDCLAAHDLAAKAEALREAADEYATSGREQSHGVTSVLMFMHIRADQIEGNTK